MSLKNHPRLLRVREVEDLTGFSKRTIYRWMSQDRFPKQIPLGRRVVVWQEKEILSWCFDQINGRSTC